MEPISSWELFVYGLVFLAVAAALFRVRHVVLRGVPDLSAQAVGLVRVALGLALLGALRRLSLPDVAGPGGPTQEAMLWSPWGWVTYLAGHWNIRDALYFATFLAVLAFTVGLASRLSYALAVLGIVVRLLVIQEYGQGSHAWVVLPFVLAPLVLARWGDALSVDAWLRRRRGRPSRVREPGPHYGLAVWLPGLALGCAWAAAGYTKLHRSGIEWVTGGAVRYHWAEDYLNAKVSWGGWIAGHEPLAILMSAGGIGIELLFITHVFFRSQWVRLAYGFAGLGLLAGFYLFQGVFWYAWWIILLFFVPWQAIADLLARRGAPGFRAGAREARTGGRLGALGWVAPVVTTIAAFLLVEQAVMARERVEQMPFLTNYPMYSYTHESPQEFNRKLAPLKFYRYRVLLDGGHDVTARLTSNDLYALHTASEWHVHNGDSPLDDETRKVLVALREGYRRRFGEDLTRVRLVTEPRIFDFHHGGLTTEGAPRVEPVEVDLDRLTVHVL